jgi:hypothetical protein
MAVAVGRLSDGRIMKAMTGANVTQVQMFNLAGRFNPKTEGIATLKQVDDALNVSGTYPEVMGERRVRTGEYVVYHRGPKEPLGREIIWMEEGVRYKLLVPDVPVDFQGKQISLQKAAGMGVYDSISLLKLEQTDRHMYSVSASDPDGLTGKVRVVDFMRDNRALPDERGFPLASQPVSFTNAARRYGRTRTDFEKGATGWHGSVGRGAFVLCVIIRRDVCACDLWSHASRVALVELSPGNSK